MLGPLEAVHDGMQVPLGSRKQRALLAILLLRANEVVAPDALIDELWGERPPPSAGHTLQVYVSRLRSAFRQSGGDDGILVTRPAGYLLRVGFGELDLNRFERLAEEGRRALESGAPERAAERLREALALWRGSPLADLAFEPFARIDVERLEELRLAALEDRIDADLALGRHTALVPETERLVAQYPLRERLRGQLMLALYRAGRQADALTAYRETRDYLVGELGIEPRKELRALEQAMLRQDDSLELAPAGRAAAAVLTEVARAEPPPRQSDDPRGPPPADDRPPTSPPSRPRRRRLALAAGAGAVVIALAAGAFALRDRNDGPALRASDVHANAVVFVDGARGATVAQTDTEGTPTALSAGAGALWATDSAHDRVLKLDASGHRTVDRIQVERSPSAIVATRDGVWVANTGSGTVSEISPGSGTVVATVRVGDAPVAIAAGGGAIWVADANDGTVRRIDPQRAVVAATIQLAQSLTDIAASDDAVWVTSASAGLLTRLDIRTNRPARTTAVGNGPGAIALAGGAVWVANPPDDTVSRVDPETGAVRKLNVAAPGALVARDGALWVARTRALDLVEIDLATRALGRAIPTGSPVASLASYDGGLALATGAPPASHLGGTLRVVAGDDLDSLDPGRAWSSPGWHVLSLTNDGLVTYARIPGPGGGAVVPDLAVALPVAQDGGRTYTFQLRRGVRYSTGAPIRPADFRATFERQFRAQTGLAAFAVPIRGADRCSRTRCDLSSGIAVDDATRTITFRLSEPDPDFLYKLALPFGSVVPAGSPPVGTGARPLPATGAYRIQQYLPGREVVLVRNPHFRPWSEQAQPRGFPDRITLRLGLDPARQAAAISAGAADVMLGSPLPAALESLSRRVPLQLHSFTLPQFIGMFLNVREPPFDRVAVRRAVALAVDRTAIVELSGGSELARPTCQILPPGFPGHQPFCPYTARPNAAGVWQAPDLARARRLIAGSGTSGMRVVVGTIRDDPAKRAMGSYFVGLLNDLGYRASLRLYREHHAYYTAVGTAANHIQIGNMAWFADYQAASSFFQPLLTCASSESPPPSSNASAFCAPEIDDQIARATSLQAANPAAAHSAWGKIDREVTLQGPLLPLVNPIGVDFVAQRVGNYQRSPALGILLGRLWVR